MLQDDEDLEDELNAMPPAFRNAYGVPMPTYPLGVPAAAHDEEEEDESPDEDEDEEDIDVTDMHANAPRLLAELHARMNEAPTFRESQRRRLQ